jgi:hypothetical protein
MATGQVTPLSAPQVYDVVEIGGVVSPGICRVKGFKRPQKWDTKKGKGVRGSTSTLVQFPPAQGTITFYLWEDAHFVAWETFRTLFLYDPTKKGAQAVDIWYPTLLDLNINSVVTEDISALEPASDPPNGLWVCTVSLLEYFPPSNKPAVSTPSMSQQQAQPKFSESSQGVLPPSAQDQQQQEMGTLLKQASAA